MRVLDERGFWAGATRIDAQQTTRSQLLPRCSSQDTALRNTFVAQASTTAQSGTVTTNACHT